MVLAVGTPLLVWRLSSGPIELGWLSPYIEETLSAQDGAYMVRLERTVLAWDTRTRLLEVRAREVRAIVDGRTIASVPEMSLTLSGLRLLRGKVSPQSLTFLRPRLIAIRNPDGSFELGLGEGSLDERQRSVDAIWRRLTDPEPGGPAEELRSVAVVDADVTFEDRLMGTRWDFPDVDLLAVRDDGDVQLDVAALGRFGEERVNITARSRVNGETKAIPVAFTVDGLRPSSLAGVLPGQSLVKVLDLTFHGAGEAAIALDGRIESLGFELQAGAGVLHLPSPVKSDLAVKSARIAGKASDHFRELRLEALKLDLGGPQLTLHGQMAPRGSAFVISGQAGLTDMPINRVKELWPAELAPKPRAWILANISDGVIQKVQTDFTAQASGPDMDGLRLGSVRSVLDVQDATVRYFGPMPPATRVRGQVVVDQDKVAIRIDGGRGAGLLISGGTVDIVGLEKVDPLIADIRLKVSGTVTDALRLLDSKPLGYAAKLDLKPEMLGGTHVTSLEFRVPLLKDLLLTDLGVNARSAVSNLSIPDVLRDLDLSDGNMDLTVDTKRLEATGTAKLGGIPARLSWNENFVGAGIRRTYKVSTVLDDGARRILGLAEAPFAAPYLSGPIAAEATIAYGEGTRAQVDARFDLANARLEIPGSGWEKAAGRPGNATLRAIVDNRGIEAIPAFAIQAGDFSLRGRVSMTNGRANRVEVDKLAYGRTDVAGTVLLRDGGGVSVTFSGKSIDVVPLLKDSKDRSPPDTNLPALKINGQVERLWVAAEGALASASLDLERDRGIWRDVKVAAFAGEKPLQIQVQPQSDGNRRLLIASDDAAAVLRTFGIYDNLHGGRLDVRGVFEDSKPGQPLRGTALITDYSVTNAPTLARLLTIAALTGILDLLRGDGVSFSSLEAPFILKDGLLELTDARAFGPALGITANGQVDLDHGKIAVEGTIVPAYAINSLIGNIPLIGRLLTGDKGSGIFAATYTARGAMEEPDVSVNPLATLAPGFLRKFFQLFTPDATKARPEAGASGPNVSPSPEGPVRVD